MTPHISDLHSVDDVDILGPSRHSVNGSWTGLGGKDGVGVGAESYVVTRERSPGRVKG